MIGIIGAMDNEVELLLHAMEDKKSKTYGQVTYHQGTISNVEVVVARSGIGLVAMASCAQRMIDKYNVSFIINTGIGGATSASLDTGDIVVASDLVLWNADCTFLGYLPGQIAGCPPNFKTSSKANAILFDTIQKHNPNFNVKLGRIATADIFVSTDEQRTQIHNAFDAQACEMEGAALAETCWLNDIECSVVRCISDSGDTTPQKYREFETAAAHSMASMVIEALFKLEQA